MHSFNKIGVAQIGTKHGHAASVLSTILAIWIMWTIFIPKIWGNTVEKIHPLPSRQDFRSIMKEDRSKGIDGHNLRDERRENLKLNKL